MRRVCRALVLFAATILAPLPAAAVASRWAVNGPSRVRLITPFRIAPAGKNAEIRLGLHFLLQPEWHVYWKNSGDAGYPPTLRLSGSPVPVQGELLWPAPRRFELRGGLVAFGYEREVVYPVRGRWSASPGGDGRERERLTADLDYLVCQVDCIPFHSLLTVDQPLGPPEKLSADPETVPWIERAWSQLPVAAGDLPGITAETAFTAAGPGGRPALTVRIQGATPAATAGPAGSDLFLEPQDLFETGKPERTREAGAIRFRVPLTLKQSGKPLPATFPFAWTATGLHPLQGAGPAVVALAARATLPLHPAAPARGTAAAGRPATARGLDPGTAATGLTLLAVLSTFLALGLWGLLGPGLAEAAGVHTRSPRREALGFLAAGVTLALLYRLSRSVRAEGLAGVELALLGMSLFAWLHRIAAGRSKLSWALLAALGLSAGAALWLAAQSRLG
jgi:DsbC/DsbD-like thiol-disulfide interchange protein